MKQFKNGKVYYITLKDLSNHFLNNYLDSLSLKKFYSVKGGGTTMKAKKGMTKNQKLKLNKTAAAKKKVKATKK